MGSQSCKADSTNKIYRDYGQSIKEIRQTHRKTDMTSVFSYPLIIKFLMQYLSFNGENSS